MATASSRDTASESSLSSHEKHSTSAPAAAVAADSDPTVTSGGGDNSGKANQNNCIAEIGVHSQSPSQQQNRHHQQQGRLRTGTANSKRSRADRNCSSSSSSSSTGSSSCSSRGTADRRDCGSGSSRCSRSSGGSSSRSSSGSSRSRSSSVNSRSNGCSSKGSSGSHCDDAARDDQSLVVHVDVSEDNLDSDLNVRRAGSVSAAGGPQSRSQPTLDVQQQQKKRRLQPRDERQQQEPSAAAAAAAAASQPLHRPVKSNRGGASTSGGPALAREPQDSSRLQPSHQPLKKASKSRKKVKGKKPSKPGVQNLLSQSGLLRVDPAPVKRLLAAGTKHRSLWISGLSISTKVSDLRTMFGQYGKVMSASIIKKEEERSLTFHGIVTMATAEEAERCRSSLNGSQYRGRMLEVITHVAAIAGQMSVGVNKGNEAGRDRKPALPRNRSPDCLTSGLQPTGEKHQSRDAVRQAGPKPPEMVSANPRERSPLQRAQPEHRGAGSTDRFLSQDRVLQQLHCIADETQLLKEARAKLVADKELLRSERQLAEIARSEFGDVCRQRLRLEREIHELQARCARERADLMRLQEQRARELPPPPFDNVRREEMLTAPANSTLPAVGASPVHNSDRTAACWAGGWQQATPDASFSAAVGVNITGHRTAIQGPAYSAPSVSTDQLLCIGGVLYRVGGGDGNVLVLSRLSVDVQPVVIPGISRVLNQPPVDSAANVGTAMFPQGREFPLAVQQSQPLAKEPAVDRHCSGGGASPGLLVDAPQRRSSGGDTAAATTAEQRVSDVHVAMPGGS